MLQKYSTRLIEKKPLTANVCSFWFELISPTRLDFIPGQYMILNFCQNSKQLKRLYSIASPNKVANRFRLVVQFVPGGQASSFLKSLKEGSCVDFEGPAGVFSLKKDGQMPVFFVTGTGIAPAFSMLSSDLITNKPAFLFWGIPTLKDLYLFEEIKKLVKESNDQLRVKICLSQEANLQLINPQDQQFFALGRINQGFEGSLAHANIKNSTFYLCGSRTVVEASRQYLQNAGIATNSIVFERF